MPHRVSCIFQQDLCHCTFMPSSTWNICRFRLFSDPVKSFCNAQGQIIIYLLLKENLVCIYIVFISCAISGSPTLTSKNHTNKQKRPEQPPNSNFCDCLTSFGVYFSTLSCFQNTTCIFPTSSHSNSSCVACRKIFCFLFNNLLLKCCILSGLEGVGDLSKCCMSEHSSRTVL